MLQASALPITRAAIVADTVKAMNGPKSCVARKLLKYSPGTEL